MTALSGFASNFAMLATARIGVGIGEASASPAAYSMISDYFPKEKRGDRALHLFGRPLYRRRPQPAGRRPRHQPLEPHFPDAADAPLGLLGWQAAFLAVGIPGLLLALWVLELAASRCAERIGRPCRQPVVRPNAWRDFGRELAAILPPLTLISAAQCSACWSLNLARPRPVVAVGAFALGSR